MVFHCSIYYFRESSQSLRFIPFRCKDPWLKYTLHGISKKKYCTRELKQTRETSLKTVTIGERLNPAPLKQRQEMVDKYGGKLKGGLVNVIRPFWSLIGSHSSSAPTFPQRLRYRGTTFPSQEFTFQKVGYQVLEKDVPSLNCQETGRIFTSQKGWERIYSRKFFKVKALRKWRQEA